MIAINMTAGRPGKKPRTEFGTRLAKARQDAGLSQAELGARVGVQQRTVARWERETVAISTKQLAVLAEALGVSVDELIRENGQKPKRKVAPSGRMRQLFQEAAKLPKRQQQKIADVIQPFITQHTDKT